MASKVLQDSQLTLSHNARVPGQERKQSVVPAVGAHLKNFLPCACDHSASALVCIRVVHFRANTVNGHLTGVRNLWF